MAQQNNIVSGGINLGRITPKACTKLTAWISSEECYFILREITILLN
jgi:hypothetical protein